MKHLKRKNAELAVIAKRLEERARKLQEANLKVVSAGACHCWAWLGWEAELGLHRIAGTSLLLLLLS